MDSTKSIRTPFSRQTVRPYATIATLYDALLGDHFFPKLRRIFERIIQYYDICFTRTADVACGSGTFVRYLRERGVPIVYGVDRSLEMLCLAIAKNHGNGARFLHQGFASLQLPQPVDLITCNFDSLNYLLTHDNLSQALHRFHTNLKPGGYVIFDMITDQPPWQGPRLNVEYVTSRGINVMRVTDWDPRRCIQTSRVSISRNGRSQREIHVQRGYPVAVVANLLAQAQFNLLGVHDFQTLDPVTPQTGRAVYVVSWEK